MLRFLQACGLTLDEWQAYVIGGLFDVGPDQTWAATEFGALISRQNGKGEFLVGYDLAHLFLFPRLDNRRKTILHTAHEMKTAIDGFQRLVGVIEANPKLMARVANIYTANGQEGIVLKKRPGQLLADRIRFIARSKSSGRGFTADVLVYDEAQELSLQAQRALTYTQSQVQNRQELFTGTVPEEGVNDCEVWQGVRDRGRTGRGKRTGWMEWTPEGSDDPEQVDDIDLGDPKVWADSNPSLGIRMPVQSVVDQYERAMETDPEGFARERLSIWPNPRPAVEAKLSELDLEQWKKGIDPNASVQGDGTVIAIALGRGGRFATIGKANRYDSDTFAVEHHKTEMQTRWVAAEVKELREQLGGALVVLDAKNAAPIVTSLTEAKIPFMAMNLDEIAAAHSLFIEYVNAGLVAHRDQDEVTKSLRFATTRPIGRAGDTWEASDPSKPITMAQVVTWALWGVFKSEATPKKQKPASPAPRVVKRADVGRDEVNLATFQF